MGIAVIVMMIIIMSMRKLSAEAVENIVDVCVYKERQRERE